MTPAEQFRLVLSRYPSAVAAIDWTPLGNAGGFSGARVWRGDLAGQPALCLKAWPPGYPADRLATIHRWMADARPTGLVPAIVPTLSNETIVEHAGRVWDVTVWAPGAADFRRDPTDAKLATACAALAALHRCWVPPVPPLAPCPGVLRRLVVLNEFVSRVWPRRLDPTYKTALDLLATHVPSAIAALHSWANQPVPGFPCLCDIWHDHVFFDGERVSSIIDYGAMKIDHPAVDLARLLGDLTDGDPDRVRVGLDAYRAAGGPVPIDPRLVTVLDRTGLVCAVIHWVNRPELTRSGDALIVGRVSRLIGRLADS